MTHVHKNRLKFYAIAFTLVLEIAAFVAIREKGIDMDMTGRFLAVVLKHDEQMTAKAAATMKLDAANDVSYDDADWQELLASDPAYIEWIERQAEAEDYRNARW